MSVAAASLLLPSSLAPQTLALCKSAASCRPPISLSSSSLVLHARPFSASPPFLPFRSALFLPTPASHLVLKVAVSSEFDQAEGEEEVGGFGDGDQQSFSPDLKLFVGNLPFSVDSSTLAALFERAGKVEMVEVIYDKATGRSRGFGFVTMSTTEEVEAAAQQFNGYELEGRPLRVNFGPPPVRKENQYSGRSRVGASFDDANRLYIGNLPWGVDDLALQTLFSEQGKVLDAKVVYDRESGRSRGFGFVTYGTAEEVNNAIDSLNGADLDGRSIRVSVAESRPRRQV